MEHSQLYHWFEKILKYNQPSGRDEPSPIKSFKQKLIITCYIKTLELTFLFRHIITIFTTIQHNDFKMHDFKIHCGLGQ